jgi:ribosome production factor 2
MFIRGGNVSQLVTDTMDDLSKLKKPHAISYKRKNIMRPFEDPSSLEFFSQKCDSSLFVFGSHNKKRPHNLVIGRMFDYHILDMMELGIKEYKSLQSFSGVKAGVGTKPFLIFNGDIFETDPEYSKLKNLFIDMFHLNDDRTIALASLQHVISFTYHEGIICFRVYRICLKKSGVKIPRVELEEMGPSLDLVLRRTHVASSSLFKEAIRQPKQSKIKKVKNVSVDPFGSQLGRIHMTRQDLTKLKTRKVKGLKRSRDPRSHDEDEEPSPKKTQE